MLSSKSKPAYSNGEMTTICWRCYNVVAISSRCRTCGQLFPNSVKQFFDYMKQWARYTDPILTAASLLFGTIFGLKGMLYFGLGTLGFFAGTTLFIVGCIVGAILMEIIGIISDKIIENLSLSGGQAFYFIAAFTVAAATILLFLRI